MNFTNLIDIISPYIIIFGKWTYLVVFLSVIFETLIGIGLIYPGTSIIIIISFFSNQIGLDPKIIFLYSLIATLIGVIINYFLGVKYIHKFSDKDSLILNSKLYINTRKIISLNPIKSIVFGRLTPGLKEAVPFVSGILRINFYKFIFYTIIGTFLWGISFIAIPYLFFSSLELAEAWLDRFSYFILILFFILLIFSILQYFLKKYFFILLSFIGDIFGKLLILLSKQKNIKKFIKNHSKFVKFIKNRLNKKDFYGLPLTILSILIIYTIFSFLGLIENILKSDIILGLDYRLNSFFYAFRDDFLVNIFLWITSLGRTYIIIIFFILVSIYLFIINKKNEIISLYISIVGSVGFSSLLKLIFHHTRPEYGVYLEKSYSFPSNHASISITFYGFLFWLLIKNTKKWETKINYFFGSLILIFLVGFSRLYLGVHYLSDVLGGYLIGVMFLFFVIGLNEVLNTKYKYSILKIKSKTKKLLGILFLILAILFYIIYNFLNPYKIITNYTNNINIINIDQINNIFKNENLKYSQNFLGYSTENINFIFLSKNDDILVNIFETGLWNTSDKLNYNSLKMISKNLFLGNTYEKAPISPIFWNNKTQDFSFQKLTDKNDIRYRHHIRIWKTQYKYLDSYIYVGFGVFDDGLKWNITHKIDPDINKEREYIFKSLFDTNLINDYKEYNLVEPFIGKNIYLDEFFSDGKAYIIKIK